MSDRLLLVEPEPTLRGQLARFLGTLGHTVESVATAGAALAIFQTDPPELVLLDTHLEEDPATVAFATQNAGAGLIVLGRSEEADRFVADIRTEIRPDHVLYKPFSAQGLADAVAATLAARREAARAEAERARATDELDAQLNALQAALDDLGSKTDAKSTSATPPAAPPAHLEPDEAHGLLADDAPSLLADDDGAAHGLLTSDDDGAHGLLAGQDAPPAPAAETETEPVAARPVPRPTTGPLLDDAALPEAPPSPAELAARFSLHPMSPSSPQDPRGIYGPVSMPELLYNCFRDLFSGWLLLRRGVVEKTVLWRAGRPIHAQSNVKAETLGSMLVESGRLRKVDHERSLEHGAAHGLRQGQAIVELGMLSEGEIRETLRDQVRARLVACFDWTGAEYGLTYDQHAGDETESFEVNPLLVIFAGIKTRFPLPPLVAHYDQMIKMVPRATARLNDYRTMLRAHRDELRVAELCDGSRVLGEVLSVSPHGLVDTLRIVRALEAMNCLTYAPTGRTSMPRPRRRHSTGGFRAVARRDSGETRSARRTSNGPTPERTTGGPRSRGPGAKRRDEGRTTGAYRAVRRTSGAVPAVDGGRRSGSPPAANAPRGRRTSSAPVRPRRSVSRKPEAQSAAPAQQMSPAELVDHLEAQENYYALLGVSTQAPRATISTVASALIRSLSKAMTGAAGDEIAGRAKRQFDRINKAGEVLTHRQRRATYDALHLPIPPASGTDLIAAESDFKRGRLCMAQENMERARGWFERAAAQDPHQAIYQVYLGWATFGLTADTNRRARLKALELAKDALKTDPSRDDGHVLVGQMHQAMGSHDAAVRAFQKALEVNGGNADARAALAALEEDPQKRPNNRLFGKLFTRR